MDEGRTLHFGEEANDVVERRPDAVGRRALERSAGHAERIEHRLAEVVGERHPAAASATASAAISMPVLE